MHDTDTDALSCFLPALAKRRLLADSGPESFPAAVLFADISGFSKLASRLAEYGSEGAEELNLILNAYYGQLVDVLQSHGGDIVNFAGDAILTVWPARPDELAATVQRAAQGSLEVQQKLNNYEVVPGVRLSLRMAIGAGEVIAAPIGGIGNYRQLAIVGQPLDQLWKGDKLARVGDVVLSPDAWKLVRGQIDGERLADGHRRIQSVTNAIERMPLASLTVEGNARAALRSYVPRTVLARVDAGQANYLADLRRVTVMFVKFLGIDPMQVGQLQAIMEILQATMDRYEGTVVQLMTDDKGTVGIACFGLPPSTHEDDAVRAILAAEAIQIGVLERGWQAGIGMATGRVFCGPLGSQVRQIYTIIGNQVNLAARLMQQAQTDILCDAETERATRGRVKFHSLPRFVIKGMPDPLPVYRPESLQSKQETARLVGRTSEREVFEQALRDTKAGKSVAVSIEGEGGIGKSTLVATLLERAQELGLRRLNAACSAIEKQTPYFVWRAVFAQLLGLEAITGSAARQSKVLEQLPKDEEKIKLASLLNPLLGVNFPTNEIVDQLDGRTRAQNLHAVLLALLHQAAARQPMLIVLDDVQWLDSASWRFLQLAHRRISPLCLAIAMRPLPAPQPEEYVQLLSHPRTRRLKLDYLSRPDCLELARRTLGIAQLSDRFAEYLFERSQGNPFFVRELASFMREAKLITVKEGCCGLEETSDGEALAAIPTAISDLITSRIDQLALPEQMTLKTASVIGRSFPHPTLKDVYPVVQERERLLDYLQLLDRQELTGLEAVHPVLRYYFRHVTIQQTAYDQLPVANRRQLHREVALWYESRQGDDPSCFPLLAYHWGKSGTTEKHIEYLAKSGDEALRGGANREAEKFFHQALDRHVEKFGDVVSKEDRLLRARWQRRRGDALYHLGVLPEARACLGSALALLERPAPRQPWKVRMSTLKQGLAQLVSRLRRGRALPKAFSSASGLRAEQLHEASLANERLARIYYFENNLGIGVYHILCAVNEGEIAGRTPELSRLYGKMCICMSLMPCVFMAEHYAHLAITTARETKDFASIAEAQSTICMYRMGAGQWDQVAVAAEETVTLSRQLGDLERLAYGITTQAVQTCFQAQFDVSLKYFTCLCETASQSGNSIYQAWGLCGQAECWLRKGELQRAISLLEETNRLLQGKDDRTEEVRASGLLAAACWQFGQESTALAHADAASELIARCSTPTCTILEGFAGPAEVYLRNWEQNGADPSGRAAAIKATSYVTWYAKKFPIGGARARRLQGLVDWLANRPRRARKHWTESLSIAQRLGLPYEVGMAHYELGRHAEFGSKQRQEHIEEALRIFEAIGTTYEYQLAKQALNPSESACCDSVVLT